MSADNVSTVVISFKISIFALVNTTEIKTEYDEGSCD